ncbi:hypothetical protein F5Y16DRAFT_394921 [Xylariaceae sp. FL0255]|nr:hypothetical protein F5Y16DRAFT_394921 [Xylariaceae sp. FL0255]
MAPLRQALSLCTVLGLAAAAPTKRSTLPDYALTYAPLSYLYSGENYWPSDVATHLKNVQPEVNYVPIGSAGSVTLANVNSYNSSTYLTAVGSTTDNPAWILSAYGKPNNSTGASGAPGTIIAVEKNSTWTDVFYFHFYSYNYGGKTLDINFDDHVGDWEHIMIRFFSGVPYAIYHSEHGAGSAYYWDVMTFQGKRPNTYIGNGTHANWAKPGKEEYTFAGSIVEDTTDMGYLWDMTLNYRGYFYDNSTNTFTTAGGAGTGGTEESGETASWLSFLGMWGDEQYPSSFPDQYCIFGECHYTSGPTGPIAKNLGRNAMCETESDCTIFTNINDITSQS